MKHGPCTIQQPESCWHDKARGSFWFSMRSARRSVFLSPPLLAAALALLLTVGILYSQQQGKILRPADGSSFPSSEIDIVATAPGGRLELDGRWINAEEPFRDVFHARAAVADGEHRLALIWAGSREEISFFAGSDPPARFKPFVTHPPVPAQCTDCHGVSRRGRFRFEGGCFRCHQESAFTSSHPHPVHVLEQCGMCHNAHGSTAKAHLIHSREVACKQCHN